MPDAGSTVSHTFPIASRAAFLVSPGAAERLRRVPEAFADAGERTVDLASVEGTRCPFRCDRCSQASATPALWIWSRCYQICYKALIALPITARVDLDAASSEAPDSGPEAGEPLKASLHYGTCRPACGLWLVCPQAIRQLLWHWRMAWHCSTSGTTNRSEAVPGYGTTASAHRRCSPAMGGNPRWVSSAPGVRTLVVPGSRCSPR